MKHLFGLTLCFLFFSFSTFAQDNNKVEVSEKKTTCVPTKECAKKMGMTVAECKAKCLKGKTASTELTSDTQVLSVVAEGEPAKGCCGTIEECAQKMGMTVAECKAKCAMVHKGETAEEAQTRVAAATQSRDLSNTKQAATKPAACAKTGKKCCKKK